MGPSLAERGIDLSEYQVQEALPSSQVIVDFATIYTMSSIDAPSHETTINKPVSSPVVSDIPTKPSSTDIPEIFKRSFDDAWEYRPMERIKEKIEWLGAKKDENGKVIRSIMGSVVGRTGREVVVVHAGDVKENMIQVDTYVRYDSKHPNPDLLEIGELIHGDTGEEVKITQNEQPLNANTHEYSGWYVPRKR